jgi:hypothetical protein
MKKMMMFFLLFLCSTLYAAEYGFISVTTGEPRSEIHIDGKMVGRDFIQKYPVEPGEHYVRITYDDKLMYSEKVSVDVDQLKLINSEHFVDLKTNVANRGAIDREARRLQEVKGNVGVGVVGGINFPASGLSLKWIPLNWLGFQLSGIANIKIDQNTFSEYGVRFIFPVGKRVLWNSVLSGYIAPGYTRHTQTGKDAYDADIAGVGLGLEWAPFNPIFFSAEVSTGYIMKNTNKNELFTGASAGIHVFF